MTVEEWIPIIKKMWIEEFIKVRDKYFEDAALGRTNSHPEKQEEIKEWYKTIKI